MDLAAKYNGVDSIWVMNAIDSSNQASMVFQFKNNTTLHPSPYTFYNFTQPCPDACPDVLIEN